MKKRIIVCGIISDGNKILLGKKEKGRPPYPDVWHTLGGGIDDLEKGKFLLEQYSYNDKYFHNELKREMIEEAGIKIKNIKNICTKYRKLPREATTENKYGNKTHYIFLEYLCELDEGEAKPNDDIAELRWINKDDLNSMQLTPPSQEMYRELGWL